MIARSDGVAKRDCIQQPSQIWERWMPKAELRWGCPELDRLSYRTKMCDSSTVALIFEVGQKWKSRRGGSSPGLLLKNEYKLNFRSKMSQSQSQRWIGLPKKTNSSVTPKIRPHAPGKCSCMLKPKMDAAASLLTTVKLLTLVSGCSWQNETFAQISMSPWNRDASTGRVGVSPCQVA